MQTTARSLVLDLLATLRQGSMPVRALIEAGAILGIADNNIRVSLARLYASGHIERDERGRYRLGPTVAAMTKRIQSWRTLTEPTRKWSGSWIGVHQTRLGRGRTRRRRERALELLGFRELAPGFAVRPDNLRGGVDSLRQRLIDLATPPAPASSTDSISATPGRVFVARDFDSTSHAEAFGLWDVDALAREAHESTVRLRASASLVEQRSVEEAMAETFLVGGGVLRQLLRHPLLPSEILDPEPLATLLDAMKSYDQLGRNLWAPFLARHDVRHRALPLDSRGSTGALVPVHY